MTGSSELIEHNHELENFHQIIICIKNSESRSAIKQHQNVNQFLNWLRRFVSCMFVEQLGKRIRFYQK